MAIAKKVSFGLAAMQKIHYTMAEPQCSVLIGAQFLQMHGEKMLFSRPEWDWEGTGKKGHGFPKRTKWSGSLLLIVTCRFIEEAWELCSIESLQDRKEQDGRNTPNHDGIDKAIVVFF